MKRCARTHRVIFVDSLEAKIALASRMARDKGERSFYRCKFGNHYHLSMKRVLVD